MKALSVQLLPPSRPSRWTLRLLCLTFLCAIAVIGAGLNRHRELEGLREQLRELMRSRSESPVAPPIVRPRRPPYDTSARDMLAEATAGWPAMLTTLETVAVPGVTPISIEIIASDGQARVELEFSDYAALLSYLDDLNAGETVPRWALIQAQGLPSSQVRGSVARAVAQIRGEWRR